MCGKALFCAWLFFFFTGYYCLPPGKPAEDNSSTCQKDYQCVSITSCGLDVDATLFECSNEGGVYKICCPIGEQLNVTTSKPPDSIMKTSSTAKTTPKPSGSTMKTTLSTAKPTTKPINMLWSKIPNDLKNKVKLLPNDCGITKLANRIVNGEDSELGQFPWMVLLGYEVDGEKQFWCGGTLINKRYVLTAAHCGNVASFQPKFVRLGEWNISSVEDCTSENLCAPPPIDVGIEEIKVHEKFGDKDLPSFQNDIALLRMEKDVEFNDFVCPVCLYPEILRNVSAQYTISGWGISEAGSSVLNPVLQHAIVKLYDIRECNAIAPAEVKPLAKSQFCAGGSVENTCKGDSGGPLTFSLTTAKNIFQKGIVSLATSSECGVEEKPNIYTEVAFYIKWILKNIK